MPCPALMSTAVLPALSSHPFPCLWPLPLSLPYRGTHTHMFIHAHSAHSVAHAFLLSVVPLPLSLLFLSLPTPSHPLPCANRLFWPLPLSLPWLILAHCFVYPLCPLLALQEASAVLRSGKLSLEVPVASVGGALGHRVSSRGVTWQCYALFPHFCNCQATTQRLALGLRPGGTRRAYSEKSTGKKDPVPAGQGITLHRCPQEAKVMAPSHTKADEWLLKNHSGIFFSSG